MKALLELVNCDIWTSDVPGLVIDTVRNTGVPIVTSPKSTVSGAICSAVELADANGLEFEPQPERARLSAAVATLKAMAPIVLRNLFSV